MKKVVAFFLALVMVCGLAAVSFAEEGEFEVTRAVTAYFDEKGVPYVMDGMTESGREKIKFDMPNRGSSNLKFYIDENGVSATLILWNIINFDPSSFEEVVHLCNKLNMERKYVKFYADGEDNSVNINVDIIIMNAPNCGEILYETADWVLVALNEVYSELEPYAV